jgi:arginyl-tRNA synthetase
MSSPNIAKPFGIGHLRSTIIGKALVNLYRAAGYEVVNVNHLGDWGTQFGKLIVAYSRWGDRELLEQEPIRESLRLYVKFHEQSDNDPNLEDEAREAFAKLERGDPEIQLLWQYLVNVSMKEFQRVYDRLDVTFDYNTGESFYLDKIDAVVSQLQDLSLLEESEGAQVVRLDEEQIPPCLILKNDGSTIYAVRDLATALYRKHTLHADSILYVVGSEQSLHLQQVFSVLRKMGYTWWENCHHVPFGLMTLDGKKMSTRKGKVVFLEEVLDEAVLRAEQIINEKNPDLPNKKEIAEAVGVGAVIFGDFKHHRLLSVDFNLEEAVSFDGETGPYLQYTYARICSLIRKGSFEELRGIHKVDGAFLSSETAWECLKTLSRYEAVLQEAIRDNEPFIVARYLLDLAKNFNRFYNSGKIISEHVNETEKFAKLSLSAAVANVLKHGLTLLGMKTPQDM